MQHSAWPVVHFFGALVELRRLSLWSRPVRVARRLHLPLPALKADRNRCAVAWGGSDRCWAGLHFFVCASSAPCKVAVDISVVHRLTCAGCPCGPGWSGPPGGSICSGRRARRTGAGAQWRGVARADAVPDCRGRCGHRRRLLLGRMTQFRAAPRLVALFISAVHRLTCAGCPCDPGRSGWAGGPTGPCRQSRQTGTGAQMLGRSAFRRLRKLIIVPRVLAVLHDQVDAR